MSTYCTIFMKNADTETYSGVSVKYDGYIENGVGECLYNCWNDIKRIKELCFDSRSDMRILGRTLEECDWFKDEYVGRAEKFKNLTYDEMVNIVKNFGITYIFDNCYGEFEWFVLFENEDNVMHKLSSYF